MTRPPGASAWILASRRGSSTGLVSKSSQPAASAFSLSPVIALAVSAITGMCFVSGAALIWRVASEPSSTGRPMSIRISSGCSASAIATPWAPSRAISTSKPARFNRRSSM